MGSMRAAILESFLADVPHPDHLPPITQRAWRY